MIIPRYYCVAGSLLSQIDKVCISNHTPELHNITAYTEFGVNLLIFIYTSYPPEMKQQMNGCMTDRWSDYCCQKH